MKKLIITVLSISALALIAFTLYENKQEMKEEAKLAEISSKAIPVKVITLENRLLETKMNTDGTFEAISDVAILSEASGEVVSVYKKKGDKVKKGDLLAQIENESIQTEVLAAEANLAKLKSDLKRFSVLSEKEAVTKRQLEEISVGVKSAEAQLRSAKDRLDKTYIRATTKGTINDDFIQEGSFISPGVKLYEIVDASKLKLSVKLADKDILKVDVGDSTKISSQVYPQEKFMGVITSVATKADAGLKYEVEIELINDGVKQLKPGMYATAYFDFESTQKQFYLDRSALIGSVQNPQVYVVKNNHSFLKSITLGEVRNDLVEVVDGLSPNELIVTSGQINLTDSTKVTVLD